MDAGRPVLSALAAVALFGAGCGGDSAAEDAEPAGVGQVRAGSVAPLAQCSDWVEGTREQRLVTIHDIRAQLNQTGGGEPTSDLNDEDAYALLQRTCAQRFAVGFRLYKIYARGAAFDALSDD